MEQSNNVPKGKGGAGGGGGGGGRIKIFLRKEVKPGFRHYWKVSPDEKIQCSWSLEISKTQKTQYDGLEGRRGVLESAYRNPHKIDNSMERTRWCL